MANRKKAGLKFAIQHVNDANDKIEKFVDFDIVNLAKRQQDIKNKKRRGGAGQNRRGRKPRNNSMEEENYDEEGDSQDSFVVESGTKKDRNGQSRNEGNEFKRPANRNGRGSMLEDGEEDENDMNPPSRSTGRNRLAKLSKVKGQGGQRNKRKKQRPKEEIDEEEFIISETQEEEIEDELSLQSEGSAINPETSDSGDEFVVDE